MSEGESTFGALVAAPAVAVPLGRDARKRQTQFELSTRVENLMLGLSAERSDDLDGQPNARAASDEKPSKNSRSASGKGFAARVPSAMVRIPLSAHHTLDFANSRRLRPGRYTASSGESLAGTSCPVTLQCPP